MTLSQNIGIEGLIQLSICRCLELLRCLTLSKKSICAQAMTLWWFVAATGEPMASSGVFQMALRLKHHNKVQLV